MTLSSLPTFGFQPGVRCAAAQRFEERHPRIRFMAEPEGGEGGANGGAGGGDGSGSGSGDGGEDQLGEGGKKALDAERTARKDADARAAAAEAKVKEFEDGKLSADDKLKRDVEESKGRVSELESENTTLKLDNARLLVAITEKVPAEWAERIKGATPEEMTADAKKIKASLRDEGEHTPGAGERGSDAQSQSTPGFGSLRDAYAESTKK